MSWTSDPWYQDDTKNHGFPFTAAPVPETSADVKSIWSITNSENFGFPFVDSAGIPHKSNMQHSMWKLHSAVNFGFPYIVTLEKIPPEMPVFSGFSISGLNAGFHQRTERISLYIGNKTDFYFKMPETLHFYFPDMKDVNL